MFNGNYSAAFTLLSPLFYNISFISSDFVLARVVLRVFLFHFDIIALRFFFHALIIVVSLSVSSLWNSI